jgi:hypothetical protein
MELPVLHECLRREAAEQALLRVCEVDSFIELSGADRSETV